LFTGGAIDLKNHITTQKNTDSRQLQNTFGENYEN